MQIVTKPDYHTDSSVVVLGMFDGVHIGHRVLIQKGRRLADTKGVPLIVSTFSDHPLSLIAPDQAPKILTTLAEKAEIMEKLGVDALLVQTFTPEVMNTHPADYIGRLVRRFHPSDVVCGYNHHFGKLGKGTPAYLQTVGLALGFTTWVVPQITIGGKEVSSTAIRQYLTAGLAAKAAVLLGRPYSYTGMCGKGCFTADDSNKVMLPAGRYYGTVENESGCLPCLIRFLEDGSIQCGMKKPAEGKCRLAVIAKSKD